MKEQSGCKQNRVLRLEPRRIDRDSIIAFANAFDPQPAHIDERAAQATPLHGLSASGWHTCTLIAEDLLGALAKKTHCLGITGIDDLRWLKPVRPGDDLSCEVRWGPSTRCSCDPALVRCHAEVEARNQFGETVVRWSCQLLLREPTRTWRSTVHMPWPLCEARRPRPTKVTSRRGDHLIKYFEDVWCGEEIALGTYTFDSSNVSMFEEIVAGNGDCIVREAGSGKYVSDWHVVAAWMSLIVAYYKRRAAQLAAAGCPVPTLGPATGVRWLRWHTPVSVGDQISFRSWAEHKVSAVSRGRWGLLVAGAEGRNQHGEVVVSFYPQFLLERRPTDHCPDPAANELAEA